MCSQCSQGSTITTTLSLVFLSCVSCLLAMTIQNAASVLGWHQEIQFHLLGVCKRSVNAQNRVEMCGALSRNTASLSPISNWILGKPFIT